MEADGTHADADIGGAGCLIYRYISKHLIISQYHATRRIIKNEYIRFYYKNFSFYTMRLHCKRDRI